MWLVTSSHARLRRLHNDAETMEKRREAREQAELESFINTSITFRSRSSMEDTFNRLYDQAAEQRATLEAMMQKKIIEFTNLLRKSGIRVSVAEGIDAFNALDELSLDDRDVFQDALRSSMVKRGDEIPTFDELFNLFWSGFYDNLKGAFGDMEGDLSEMGIDLEELLAQLAEMKEGLAGNIDQPLRLRSRQKALRISV